MMFLSFITDIFQQEIVLRVLIAGIMLGILAPLLGSFVVVRRLSFIADTLGHFSLVGISVSLFLSSIGLAAIFDQYLYLGIVFSLIGGLLIELFRRSYKNFQEISMVIVISLGTALSAIFLSLSNATGSLFQFLFGSIVTIKNSDIVIILITTAVIGLLLIFFGKRILAVSFDESSAKFLGINVGFYQITFILMLSVVVSVLLQSAGVLLISSMMVIPVAAGMKLGWSFKSTLIISIIFSEVSVFFGLWLAYTFSIPSGASIVSINIIILLVVASIKKITQKIRIAKIDKLK